MTHSQPVALQVKNLTARFEGQDEPTLHDVTFSVRGGGITAIVGETGSGKSLTALTALGIQPENLHIESGEIVYRDQNLLALDDKAMRAIRGSGVAMVFQDARTALNPLVPVGRQLADTCQLHHRVTRRQAYQVALETLAAVKIPDPSRRARQYPHEFSGGMAQRVMIAMALICQPQLVILDEPTTGLDVTIQAEIMELILSLGRGGMTGLLITHDLGVVAETCDEVIVMRHGRVIETAPVRDIFEHPQHEYTRTLVAASQSVYEGFRA